VFSSELILIILLFIIVILIIRLVLDAPSPESREAGGVKIKVGVLIFLMFLIFALMVLSNKIN